MTSDPLADALHDIRGLRDSEIAMLVAAARAGDGEAIEWTMARCQDLDTAIDALRTIAVEGLRAGGWRTVSEYATDEGIVPQAVRQRIRYGHLEETRGPVPDGMGPRVQIYVRAKQDEDGGRRDD